MFNYLWKDDTSVKKFNYRNYNNIKYNYHQTLNTIKEYYKKDFTVIRPHLIVSLINSLDINFNKDIEDVYIDLLDNSIYIANTLKLVTTINKNTETFNGVVMKNVDEVFVYREDTFNIKDLNNYKDIVSVECIYTTISDIFATHPYMYKKGNNLDYNIYTIDVVKLGIQYYLWYKEQMENELSTNIGMFVFNIVLNNVIDSISDISIFNRQINIFNNIENNDFINNNVFNIRDDSRHMNKLFKIVYDDLVKNDNLTIKELLSNIPVLVKNNSYEIIDIPNILYNKRNKWVFWLSRFDYIIFILKFTNSKLIKDFTTSIAISLRYDIRNRIFEMKNKELEFIIKEKIQTINNLIKEK